MTRRTGHNAPEDGLPPEVEDFASPYRSNPESRMEAFDRLPPDVRQLLNYGPPLDPDPIFTLRYLQEHGHAATIQSLKAALMVTWSRLDTAGPRYPLPLR